MEGLRNEEQSVVLGRRFRSVGETLYSGVTERRGEEGNAGSQWKRTRRGGCRGAAESAPAKFLAEGGKSNRKKKEKTVDTKQGDRLTTNREEAMCVMLQ